MISIYDDYPQIMITDIRDKVFLGLYIYQGIKSSEISLIHTEDIDITGYSIQLYGDNRTNPSKIGLDIRQIIVLSDYLNYQ